MEKIKVLIACHRPFEKTEYMDKYPDLFIPVLGGKGDRNRDIPFFYDNMVGDNTGENISWLNRYMSEYTQLYWAWKNYDKIGDPEYIGMNHYRRYWNPEEYLHQLDPSIVYVTFIKTHLEFMAQFNCCHEYIKGRHEDIINFMFNGDKKDIEGYYNYANQSIYPGCTMFVMHKNLFFDIMPHIERLIYYLADKIDFDDRLPDFFLRYPAFVLERFFGFMIILNGLQRNLDLKHLTATYLRR